ITYAKANPGKLSYGTAGGGSFGPVASAYLYREAGVELEMILYQGGWNFPNAPVGGQIDAVFTLTSAALSQSGQHGQPQAPGIPPLADTLPGFEAVVWTGLLAPAATPPEVVESLGQAIHDIVAEADTRAKIESMGVAPEALLPKAYRDEIVKEHGRWQPLIQE